MFFFFNVIELCIMNFLKKFQGMNFSIAVSSLGGGALTVAFFKDGP